MREWLFQASRGALDLLLPAACGGCGRAGETLCADCRGRLPRIAAGVCPRCQAGPGPEPCAACRVRPSALDACLGAVWFEDEAGDWVRRFKYPRPGLAHLDPGPGAALCALVREATAHMPGPAPGAVVPVPLHPRALRRRGFNPAQVLARAVARACRAPLWSTGLRRRRDTPSQTGLGRGARRRNVRGAFAIRREPPPRVWLVDDVVTTGATLEEAARTLRRAGARHVSAVCAARTP